jgi:nucleoside-diphosphate-sugar epimerase
MDKLLVFGLGYTGRAIALAAHRAGFAVTVTSRAAAADGSATADGAPFAVAPFAAAPFAIVPFAAAGAAVAAATAVVSTVPPPGDAGRDGGGDADAVDPVLHAHGAAIAAAPGLRWIGYLSTTGVYGDRGGAWVDEDTAPAPGQPRSRRRLAAEEAWRALADRRAVDLFRVAGIYGPGRSPLDDVRAGRARRVDKPDHAFGRIHRDDIAAAVVAAAGQARPPGARVLHLADDVPASQSDVVAEAARLLGVVPPPPVPFEEALPRMSEMARSFWAENRRIASARTQAALGLRWRYPSFREGLAAILAEQG